MCRNNHSRENRLIRLNEIIRPLHTLSKFFGLAPYHLNLNSIESITILSVVAFLIPFCIIFGILIFIGHYMESNYTETNIIGLILRVEFYFGLIMMATNIIFAGIRQKRLQYTLNQLKGIDQAFSNYGVILLNDTLDYVHILVNSALNLIEFLNIIVVIQFVNSSLLLWQRFKWLNMKADDLRNAEIDLFKNDKYLNLGPSSIIESQNKIEFDKQYHIFIISQIHDKLCDVSKNFNGVYSVQLLISMAARFIIVTAELIKMYKIFNNLSDTIIVSLILSLIRFLLHTSNIFMIASACSLTENEAKQTAIILHKIWDQSQNLKSQVKFFSLQAQHQYVKYSACGFFNLDYTIIYEMLGAVTTYLIIVIQFDLSRQQNEETMCTQI
ncbi:putative gustatory receptor 28a [Chrysoperla carnea]|uniref:putative gustatory receptor 28a n=1 Tax=Chrysoperla carnea TaxID=189513 RepID=UPI001D07740E|nr:putative gustatory receptor 28a [Chrysoperla carnea]